jgi:hypothetical protein
MSKIWEQHYRSAAFHHERAAYHYQEAEKCEQTGEHEKATIHAYRAHGHSLHAFDCDAAAAKLHANHLLHVDQCERPSQAASGLGTMGENVA